MGWVESRWNNERIRRQSFGLPSVSKREYDDATKRERRRSRLLRQGKLVLK